MNSSAKKTAFSFLAVAALGAAVFLGCKVDSTTSDDTDGDNNNPDNKDDAGTGTEADTGTGAPVCQSAQGAFTFPGQECLEANCCTELQNCFEIADEDGGTALTGCDAYSQCYDACGKLPEADQEDCYTNSCDATVLPAAKTAYEAIIACHTANSCPAQ